MKITIHLLIYVSPKKVGASKLLSLTSVTFFPVFHVCGPFLRSCRTCRVQCGAPVVCTVHPLLPSPAPSSATPPQLLPWSLQDDQDVSLQTCHVLKRSRLKIYQLVHSNRGDFLDWNVHVCHAVPGCTVWKRVIVCQKRVFMALFYVKIILGLF